jgi:type IV fimbrial biogenesis protein FimT
MRPVRSLRSMPRQRAFTLVELMVAIAVVAILAMLSAPSFNDLILKQRLKGTNAQLVTDLQFARSQATARNALLRVNFRSNGTMTCYSLYVSTEADSVANNASSKRCNCTLGAGDACPASTGMLEIRTVQIPKSSSVTVAPAAGWPIAFAFDPVTGGLMSIPPDNVSAPIDEVRLLASIDTSRTLQTSVNRAGRPTVCSPTGSTMAEVECL